MNKESLFDIFPEHLLDYLFQFLDEEGISKWFSLDKKRASKRELYWHNRFTGNFVQISHSK